MAIPIRIKKLLKHIFKGLTVMQRYETLGEFIKKNNYKSFAEIGVWSGDTSKYLLKHCKLDRVVCVDYYPSPYFDMGNETEVCKARKKAEELMKHPKVNFLEMKSEEASKRVEDSSIDLVYIDTVHSYETTLQDINLWLPKVKAGGILCGHNYQLEWFGVVEAVRKKFKEYKLTDNTIWWVKV